MAAKGLRCFLKHDAPRRVSHTKIPGSSAFVVDLPFPWCNQIKACYTTHVPDISISHAMHIPLGVFGGEYRTVSAPLGSIEKGLEKCAPLRVDGGAMAFALVPNA
ncbi:hypothetical protein ZHAS_00016774 [Anopheles sinensis]|uniref:Uncharacterized protein n=1 Tax=Anopheles sinensis TaxID=74873 RepID=A0A084WEX3_ANOSI|nr:hypothetical protein ZHAS_00016774 [Anopheles sinensis]